MTEAAANTRQSHPSGAIGLSGLNPAVIAYGATVLALLLALAARLVLSTRLAGETSYLFFVPAILIGSGLGGWKPGTFAALAGLALGLFFFAGGRALTPNEIVDAGAFALIGVGAVWRGELLHRARLTASANAEAALAR